MAAGWANADSRWPVPGTVMSSDRAMWLGGCAPGAGRRHKGLTGAWTVGGGSRSPVGGASGGGWGHTAGSQVCLESRATAEQGLGLQVRQHLGHCRLWVLPPISHAASEASKVRSPGHQVEPPGPPPWPTLLGPPPALCASRPGADRPGGRDPAAPQAPGEAGCDIPTTHGEAGPVLPTAEPPPFLVSQL